MSRSPFICLWQCCLLKTLGLRGWENVAWLESGSAENYALIKAEL